MALEDPLNFQPSGTDGWEPGSALSHGSVVTFVVGSIVLRTQIQRALRGSRFIVERSKQGGPLISSGARASRPSLAIVEAGSSPVGLLPLTSAIRQSTPSIRIVLTGDFRHPDWLQDQRPTWADGWVQVGVRPEILIASLDLVMLGGATLPTPLTALLVEQARASKVSSPRHLPRFDAQPFEDLPVRQLSDLETAVLHRLKEGRPNKVIAQRLDLRLAAVNTAIKGILRKVGARNRTQAALWALENLPDDKPGKRLHR